MSRLALHITRFAYTAIEIVAIGLIEFAGLVIDNDLSTLQERLQDARVTCGAISAHYNGFDNG